MHHSTVKNRSGSSPLARGLLLHAPEILRRPGIIPARAGFTYQRIPVRACRSDHPRSRGVYAIEVTLTYPDGGSSPLARGLPGRVRVQGQAPRIIPARAGFTGGCGRPGAAHPDHPRSRGVYRSFSACTWPCTGSSPLARGLLNVDEFCFIPLRIIPARAGFTMGSPSHSAGWGDHPRSRGVYPPWPPTRRPTRGSSPLARGLRAFDCDANAREGIIPARAGFTPSCERVIAGPYGSSPLARGLPGTCAAPHRCTRIIPARAGFTQNVLDV